MVPFSCIFDVHPNARPGHHAVVLPQARAHRKAQLLYYLSNAVNYYANIPDPEEERGIDSYGGGLFGDCLECHISGWCMCWTQ